MRLWDLATGDLLRELGTDGAGAVAVWTDGHRVLASGGGRIDCWTSPTGWDGRLDTHKLGRVPGRWGPLGSGAGSDRNSVAFDADGQLILGCCTDLLVRQWSLGQGACVQRLTGHGTLPHVVDLSRDGKRAVTADIHGEIRVWDVDGGTGTAFGGPDDWVNCLCLSADSRTVLVAGQSQGRTLWTMDAVTGKVLQTFESERPYRATHEDEDDEDDEDRSTEVQTAQLSRDGKYVVSGGEDGLVHIWETGTGRSVRTLEGHTGSVSALALTPDNRYLMSGSTDRTVRLWKLDWDVGGHSHQDSEQQVREATVRRWKVG
ncbi:WD40 repeat domain-containing protein [Streptomyces sp. NPDC102451]|uniref:WD40 repeat domain-containing protein n=1 Tax=Streptomyces sp. NPDC102451 TaxID=3366177 RepID=UPI003800EC52